MIKRKDRIGLAIVSGIIACLCFSVGEGLRLTPFPLFVRAAQGGTEPGQITTQSNQHSVNRYGPIDRPMRTQSRVKRQFDDYGTLHVESNFRFNRECYFLSDSFAAEPIAFLPRSPVLSDRAPPLSV